MPRYFLDTNNGEACQDGEGASFESDEKARAWADSRLFTLAMEEVGRGHEATFVLLMRDQEDVPIYRASLTMQGTWLVNRDG